MPDWGQVCIVCEFAEQHCPWMPRVSLTARLARLFHRHHHHHHYHLWRRRRRRRRHHHHHHYHHYYHHRRRRHRCRHRYHHHYHHHHHNHHHHHGRGHRRRFKYTAGQLVWILCEYIEQYCRCQEFLVLHTRQETSLDCVLICG